MDKAFTSTAELNRAMRDSALPVIGFIGAVASIGSIGNCLIMYVYSHKYPKCNFKYFVLLLATLDLTSCCFVMPLEIVTLLCWTAYPSIAMCKAKSFLKAYMLTSSGTSLLLIAIDRYRKVCRPHNRQMSLACAKRLSIFVLFLSAIPASSEAIFWGHRTFRVADSNITTTVCEMDDAFEHTIWPTLSMALLYAGPNAIAMCTTLTLYQLIASKLICGSTIASPEGLKPEIVVWPAAPQVGGSEMMVRFGLDVIDIESGLSDTDDDSRNNTAEAIGLEHSTKTNSRNNGANTTVDVNAIGNDLATKPEGRDHISDTTQHDRLDDVEEGARSSNTLPIPPGQMRKKKEPKMSTFSLYKKKKSFGSKYASGRSTVGSCAAYSSLRLRRKTLIMFILTAIFVATTLLYLCLKILVSYKIDLFYPLVAPDKTVWLFCSRLYFVNSVINPLLYGFLDPRFKKSLRKMAANIMHCADSV